VSKKGADRWLAARKKAQLGAQTVELALTFLTFIVILVGVVELIRALWMWTILGEATRRGARVAAVCGINDPAIYREVTAIPIGLAPANVTVAYDYCAIPDASAAACQFGSVSYTHGAQPSSQTVSAIRSAAVVFVRVGITDFHPRFAFLFPWGNRDADGSAILSPAGDFATTLSVESLGWNPIGGFDQRGEFQVCAPPQGP
jgi:hypothetical protein